MQIKRLIALPLGIAFLLTGAPSQATNCSVPGTYSIIQDALDDPNCTRIELENRVYVESIVLSRSVYLTGPYLDVAEIRGQIEVTGATTTATLADLIIKSSCKPETLLVSDGAQVEGERIRVSNYESEPCPLPLRIFKDGFESDDTSAWTQAIP